MQRVEGRYRGGLRGGTLKSVDELSTLDALFLHLEDPQVALHIGAVAVFDGPVPSNDELRGRYERAVAACPRYRQVLHRTRFELRRPRWVAVDEFDLDYHIRHTALPTPGRPAQLERLVGRLMSYKLDPHRPLWEVWVVEGLENGRWALVTKVHHSVVDGLGGMALFGRLLDDTAPPNSSRDRDAAGVLAALLEAVRAPGRTLRDLACTVDGALRYAASLRPTAAGSLTGPLGRARRYRALTVDLEDVCTVRGAFGGTVNDVVLAMVTRGFHGLLDARGDPAQPNSVRCLVPVATRRADEAHAGANKISMLLVDLPAYVSNVTAAYGLVRQRVDELKSSGQARAGGRGFAAADLLPAPLVAAALNVLRRIPQRVVTTVATNVPGPRSHQALLGRRMVALYPYVPIADRVQIGVAVTSYVGRLHLGVTCDRAAVPDADVFVAAMADGLADLVKSAVTATEPC